MPEKIKKFKYIEIAEKIEHLIFNGTYKNGDKLNSVRTMSLEYKISISTAFRAYYYLESKGLIEAKSRSGYYVKHQSENRFEDIKAMEDKDYKIGTLSELTIQIVKSIQKEKDQLSLLIPPIDLIPTGKLKKSAKKILQTSSTAYTEYSTIQGSKKARIEVSKLLLNSQAIVNYDDIILTNGCYEAISLALEATTEPNDIVAVESPTAFGLLQLLTSLKLKIIEIPINIKTGISIEQLEKNLKINAIKACIFIPNFNNPTGALMSDEKKQKVVSLLEKFDIPLIEDDIYGEIYFTSHRPRSCKSFDKSGNVILCSSLSKTLAPGYRFGWITPGKYYEKIYKIKHERSIYCNTLNQMIIADFLKNGRFDFHLRNYRNRIYERYQNTLQLITKYFPKNIKTTQPKGSTALWIELNYNIDATKLSMLLLKENIGLLPGKSFSTTNYFNNFIRINFSSPYSEELEYKFAYIGKILKQLNQ